MTSCSCLAICLGILAVAVCAGAIDAPSGPVQVTKKMIDSPLDDIQWADSQTVFVLSEQGLLYRSVDGGKAWTNQASKLHAATASPSVRSMHISRADPNKIFFVGHGRENWATTDMGNKYVNTQELDLHEVRLHPRQSNWILGATMSDGCKEDPKHECYKILWLTKDFGQTWAQVITYVVQFDWAPTTDSVKPAKTRLHSEVTTTKFADPSPTEADDLIYCTLHTVTKGNQVFGVWDKNIHFYQTYDYFKKKTVLVEHGNRFLFGDHNYLFIAAVNPLQETEVSLQVSKDDSHEKHFRTALLPVELTEHSYTILDTSQGSVFLHVNHAPFDQNAPTGHVYISDASGTSYSLSLPYNHRSADGKCDFEKVDGLEGIYLANFIDDTDEESEDPSRESWDDDDDSKSRRKHTRAKTVITFDKGGIWSYLDPPTVDSQKNPVKCTAKNNECHLHLHGITDLYGPFYSSASATGVIMATGTVGTYLQECVDCINTYLSRDAGLTWFEVAKGSHIYEFGDHGGIIVMAYDEGSTDVVLYSWDQGVTWKSIKISETPIQVENIIIEPEATSTHFIVYGWQDDSVGVMIYIDFAELHEMAVCKGHDAPNTPESDYETWSPSDSRLGDKCLMGHRVSYTRRKRAAYCFNPEKHERAVFLEHCPCSEEDFECDYGYKRKIEGGQCVTDPDSIALPAGPCKDFHYVTKGYRRVAGDTCVNGAKWDPITTPCSAYIGGMHVGKWMLIILILVVISLAVATFYGKIDFLEDAVDWIKAKFTNQGYSVVGKKLPHSMADDDFGLDDQEYGQSASLINDDDEEAPEEKPAPKPTKDKASKSSKASKSGSRKSDDKAETATKDVINMDDFNPRAN